MINVNSVQEINNIQVTVFPEYYQIGVSQSQIANDLAAANAARAEAAAVSALDSKVSAEGFAISAEQSSTDAEGAAIEAAEVLDSINEVAERFFVTRLHSWESPVSYIGKAIEGALTSEAVWTITKIQYSIPAVKAVGAWDNRQNLIYS